MANLMALKCRPTPVVLSTVCSVLMRSSLKLLIGLAMPSLALAAYYWLWRTRRARDKQRNHANGIDTTRELKGVAEELKVITHKACTNNGAPRILDPNYSVDHECNELTNNREKTSESVNSRPEGVNRLSDTNLTPIILGTSAETDALLKSSNECDTKSPEYFSNNQNGNHDKRENSVALNQSSNGRTENGSSQDSEKTSGRNRTGPSNSKSQDQTDSSGSNGHAELPQSGDLKTSPSDSSAVASVHELCDNASEPYTKASGARAQSLDESSDMSSGESKAESPVDLKLSSTMGSDSEPAQSEDDTAEEITWELEFPQALCGRLIGKKGKNVQKISQITGTKIRLIPQKDNTESSQRLVALTGFPRQLKRALRALREKFPGVPFTRLNGSQPFSEGSHSNLLPNIACVALPENELCQIFVTNIVDANHFYVQLYDYSVQSRLRQLDQLMYPCYSGIGASTLPPQTINTGMLCAVLSPSGWWWRAQVVGLLMKPEEVEITWLDYGGRTTIPTAALRQLREDFLQLPFQAVECYLSNVVPNHGEPQFSMAACALLEQLTQNIVLTARVTGYNRDCPNLELYLPDQWTGQSLFVNREFVRRGFARWSET